MRLFTLYLAAMILYVPNQRHFPTSFGLPGLNTYNLVLLAAFGFLLLQSNTSRPVAPAASVLASNRPPLLVPLLVFYGMLGIALLNAIAGGSSDPMADITIYKTVVTYSILYFVAYYGVHDLRSIRFLLGALLLVFVVAAFEAIREGMTYGFGNYENDRRAAGPFSDGGGNANFAGVFYSIFCAFSLTVAVLGKRLKFSVRLLAVACYVIGCIAVLATFSRQSFLILGVTTLLITFRRNPLLAVLAIMGMLAYPLWAPDGVVERIEMTQQETATGEVELEDSAASRYELWGGAVEIIRKDPLGIGLNQFKQEIEPYLSDWIMARDAQNQYLLITAEAGIQGLVAFVVLILALFGIGRRLSQIGRSHEARTLGAAMGMAVLAVVMGNIYSSTFFSGEVMGNFWILAGLMSKYRVLALQEETVDTVATAELSPVERMRHVYSRWQGHGRAERERREISDETI